MVAQMSLFVKGLDGWLPHLIRCRTFPPQQFVSIPTSQLRDLGAFNAELLAELVASPREYLVDGLIVHESVNLAVGDSGLGKTPLFVQLGLAVAAGVPFCHMPTQAGPVLYFDCESPPEGFHKIVDTITGHMGIRGRTANFICYSPQWDPRALPEADILQSLTQLVEAIRPRLVIIDPLRVVWPRAEVKSEDTVAMIQYQRRLGRAVGCSWINVHHCRKPNQDNPHPPSLLRNAYEWLLESAGSRALVNQTDTRLGMVRGNDIVVAGFQRMAGPVHPMLLKRVIDPAMGEPIAYEIQRGIGALTEAQRAFFDQLPQEFNYSEAKATWARHHEGHPNDRAVGEYMAVFRQVGLVSALGGTRGYKKAVSPSSSTSYSETPALRLV